MTAPTIETPPVPREVLQRQATTSFDRAFQNLFTLISEIVPLYRQKQAVDGGSEVDPRLEAVPPYAVEENLRAYKLCFDSTAAEVHVDTVLELYSKVRASLHRGYQCDSWLRGPTATLYYGVSAAEAGNRVLNLDCVFLMIEALKRADTQARAEAAKFRIKFANQLYTIFMAALRYANIVEGEANVRGVTPEVTVESDLTIMQGLQEDILNDIPKPTPSTTSGGPAGLGSLFQGGLGDMMSSLVQTLPSLGRTLTETLSRATGTTVSPGEQQVFDGAVGNIANLLSRPDGIQNMLAELSRGPEGLSRLVESVIGPAASGGGAGAAAAPASTIEGPHEE